MKEILARYRNKEGSILNVLIGNMFKKSKNMFGTYNWIFFQNHQVEAANYQSNIPA
jgi:hypothetical protein